MSSLENFIMDILFGNWPTWLILSLTLVLLILSYKSSTSNLAPGPKGYPFLGHLPLLWKEAHITFNEYKKKYGPIFSIRYGRKYAVVLADFNTLKETYSMKGLTDRPSESFRISTEYDNIVEVNGEDWHTRRRFAVSVIKGSRRERATEDIIQEEVTRFLENIEKRDLSEDIQLDKLLSIVTNNVGLSIMCGKSLDEDDPLMELLHQQSDAILYTFETLTLAESLGIPKCIFKYLSPKVKARFKIIKEMKELIREEIAEHEKTLNPENPRDYIDFALMEMQKVDGYKNINYQTITGDVQMFIVAGTDTIRLTLEWCILQLAKYPNIQEKIYQEIVEVLGDQRPTWADHKRLPYSQAFIMEVMRLPILAPINFIRQAPRDIKVKGFDVPKGTWIFANFYSIHQDPNLWKDPEKFDPTRFLNKEGDKVIEPEFFIPFSIGNRNCPGEQVARSEVFITMTNLIQHHRVLPSSKGVSLEGIHRISYKPLHPEARFEKRDKIGR